MFSLVMSTAMLMLLQIKVGVPRRQTRGVIILFCSQWWVLLFSPKIVSSSFGFIRNLHSFVIMKKRNSFKLCPELEGYVAVSIMLVDGPYNAVSFFISLGITEMSLTSEGCSRDSANTADHLGSLLKLCETARLIWCIYKSASTFVSNYL